MAYETVRRGARGALGGIGRDLGEGDYEVPVLARVEGELPGVTSPRVQRS